MNRGPWSGAAGTPWNSAAGTAWNAAAPTWNAMMRGWMGEQPACRSQDKKKDDEKKKDEKHEKIHEEAVKAAQLRRRLTSKLTVLPKLLLPALLSHSRP